ncbi:MAG: DNA repair exonuclease, partial [Deltaproteobacteria bacterium]|nr:DNA repair exonuclease [Deltaproteobacteria bacterium]
MSEDGGISAADPVFRRHDAPGSVRFVHAADLHLDAVFAGMARDVSPEAIRRLHQATFTALDNLFALCERVRPDLLLLGGDMYNQEDWSLRAQLAVRDGCVRLGQLGTRVFIVHGNHDPLPSRLRTLHWPDCVTIFGEEVSAQIVWRGETPLAVVHGVSHAGSKENRNLAANFARTPEACLHIGLLHTTLDEAEGERYAPCSTEDFVASGLDYWALGHIHDCRVACQTPLAQYPGSIQGLHIGEQGPHGCLLV